APRGRQRTRHGKPHREQDQIGTAFACFRVAVRVGRARRLATGVPEEWPSLGSRREQNPAYRPPDASFPLPLRGRGSGRGVAPHAQATTNWYKPDKLPIPKTSTIVCSAIPSPPSGERVRER